MTLNISKGNMYDWVTKTWNPIRGECSHKCSYCYVKTSRVKKLYTGKPHMVESAFKSLGKGHFYFVGSMIDLFADRIPDYCLMKIFEHCRKYKNKYLFQTKNPWRLYDFRTDFPPDVIIGTTIESNKFYRQMGRVPNPYVRSDAIRNLSGLFETMVTIEPIMDFTLIPMKNLIMACNPKWVNIGADSQGHKLQEPSGEKIQALIDNLKSEGVEVKLKSNLKRLMT